MTDLHQSKEYFQEKNQFDGAVGHFETFNGCKISVTDYCKRENKINKKIYPLQPSLPKLTNLVTAGEQVDTSCLSSTECIIIKQPPQTSIHHDDSKVTKEKYTSSIQEVKSPTETMNCTECGKKYKHYSSLYKHKQQVHSTNSTGQINCNENGCSFSCHFINKLRQHLALKLGMKMEEEQLVFSTYQGIQCNHSILTNNRKFTYPNLSKSQSLYY